MNKELDLLQIYHILKKKFWFLILAAVLVGGAAYCVSAYFITPKYSATASLYVYNEANKANGVTYSDLTTSQELVQTYIVVLKSNTVLNEVSKEIGGTYTADQIRDMLSASAIDNTEAFDVTITCPNPEDAKKIANTIADVAPTEIIRVVKAGSVEVIDYATAPTKPSSPNVARNTAIGALAGLVLAVIIAIVASMFDTVIRSEEDLTALFTLPIIGVIPSIDISESREGYGSDK
jgi:capsular polysaccharide biosynthesis protein